MPSQPTSPLLGNIPITPDAWMRSNGWKPFPFQRACWQAVANGKHGLLNAPTGSGKTYALFLAPFADGTHASVGERAFTVTGSEPPAKSPPPGLRLLWITPLRALSADIAQAMERAATEMGTGWTVGIRTGDTSQTTKKKQREQMPDALVITPESIHVLLSYSDTERLLADLQLIVVDEWHELMGSKRGVQTELALARLRALSPHALVWGISATIGNLDEAVDVLLGKDAHNAIRVTSSLKAKPPAFHTLMPEKIERYPWTGHIGVHMLHDAERVIRQNNSALVFTNTRSQAEIWYQNFLTAFPEYAGNMALHHGSMDRDQREWVEGALKTGKLKVVFCTSSLDLGVDFPAVDAIIQVGSPKGVARFLQRAGRSGHRPDARSKAWFLPTHALEIVEGASIRVAMDEGVMESRQPFEQPIDVLAQWLVTLACGAGFESDALLREVRSTHAYAHLSNEDWQWVLDFVTRGGTSLTAYPEFRKVVESGGRYHIANGRLALRHRMQIGTISSEISMTVSFLNGKSLGSIEEDFISRLEEGDVFLFAGRALELINVHDNTAFVKPSKSTKGAVARWVGGRMPLSAQMSEVLRRTIHEAAHGIYRTPELKRLRPMLELQAEASALPKQHEFLIETFTSREGYHAFFYPFEGRLAHEGLAALIAYRLAQLKPITFSLAMNDYAFELVSDQAWSVEPTMWKHIFKPVGLATDILNSANMAELSRRKFRDIARIAGLIFQGYPGKQKKARHLQASSSLYFDVFRNYDPGNLLLRQAQDETLAFQLDEARIRTALHRIQEQDVIIKHITAPTPFCSPVLVDRLREKMGSEKTEEMIRRMVGENG